MTLQEAGIISLTKVCNRCGFEKDTDKFYRRADRKTGSGCLRHICKDCFNIKTAIRKYGLTVEEYTLLQRDNCYICFSSNNLVIDHNHITGKVRKIICQSCNVLIGLSGESVEKLNKVISYIEEHYE